MTLDFHSKKHQKTKKKTGQRDTPWDSTAPKNMSLTLLSFTALSDDPQKTEPTNLLLLLQPTNFEESHNTLKSGHLVITMIRLVDYVI